MHVAWKWKHGRAGAEAEAEDGGEEVEMIKRVGPLTKIGYGVLVYILGCMHW